MVLFPGEAGFRNANQRDGVGTSQSPGRGLVPAPGGQPVALDAQA